MWGHVNHCDGRFIVEAKLDLRAENGEISYTIVNVPPYEKRYPLKLPCIGILFLDSLSASVVGIGLGLVSRPNPTHYLWACLVWLFNVVVVL